MSNKGIGENAEANDQAVASVGKNAGLFENAKAEGVYEVICHAPIDSRKDNYIALTNRINALKTPKHTMAAIAFVANLFNKKTILNLEKELADIPVYEKWRDTAKNVVTTVGKNYLLDNGLAGSSFTATFFLGLISSSSYSAVAAANTMASHAGWLEAGAGTAPIYSESTRPAAAWSAAASGSKSFSSARTFTIATTGGTVKGCFLTTNSTKDGTTGTLYSAGLFTGGDKVVAVADTLSVSYTATLS